MLKDKAFVPLAAQRGVNPLLPSDAGVCDGTAVCSRN